jgi:thioredoxin 1
VATSSAAAGSASDAPDPSGTGTGSAAAPAATPAGAYLTLAEYTGQAASRTGTKVVYFFHAPWCPTCRATEEAIARDGIPTGLTVVKVDFDSETDLRRTYGVTTQHTFVQVDRSGGELATWTGSRSGAEILAETV